MWPSKPHLICEHSLSCFDHSKYVTLPKSQQPPRGTKEMYRGDDQGSAWKSIKMKLLAGERNMYVVNEDHQARLQSDDKDEDDGGGDCD